MIPPNLSFSTNSGRTSVLRHKYAIATRSYAIVFRDSRHDKDERSLWRWADRKVKRYEGGGRVGMCACLEGEDGEAGSGENGGTLLERRGRVARGSGAGDGSRGASDGRGDGGSSSTGSCHDRVSARA